MFFVACHFPCFRFIIRPTFVMQNHKTTTAAATIWQPYSILSDIRVELADEFDRNFQREAFFSKPWNPKAPQGLKLQVLKILSSMKAISCPRWHIHLQYGKTSTAISIWNKTKFPLIISAPTLHVSEKQYIFANGFWFKTVWDSWLSWRRSFLLPFRLTRTTTVVMSIGGYWHV